MVLEVCSLPLPRIYPDHVSEANEEGECLPA